MVWPVTVLRTEGLGDSDDDDIFKGEEHGLGGNVFGSRTKEVNVARSVGTGKAVPIVEDMLGGVDPKDDILGDDIVLSIRIAILVSGVPSINNVGDFARVEGKVVGASMLLGEEEAM